MSSLEFLTDVKALISAASILVCIAQGGRYRYQVAHAFPSQFPVKCVANVRLR